MVFWEGVLTGIGIVVVIVIGLGFYIAIDDYR